MKTILSIILSVALALSAQAQTRNLVATPTSATAGTLAWPSGRLTSTGQLYLNSTLFTGVVLNIAGQSGALLTINDQGNLTTNGGLTAFSLSLTTDLPITEGGTGASTASAARTNLGATTVGGNLFTATNPSAITFPKIAADNSVSFRTPAQVLSDIGAGTVTSVSVTTAAGVSGSVATQTTTPAITITLGAITPTSVNGNTFTTGSYTLTGTAGKTLTFSNSITIAGVDGSSISVPASGTLYGTLVGSITSASLASSLSDETGSGIAVFGTSPSITTPVVIGGLTASGSGANTFAGSTGTFLTSTGANTLSGDTTVSAGKFLTINGATNGSLKFLPAAATAQTVTIATAAQTTGATTLTIPDQAGASRNFVFDTLAQTLTNKTIAGASNTLTVRLANDVTGTLPEANGGTGLASPPRVRTYYAAASQTVAAGVTATVKLDTEDWDVGNCFNTTTYRWTPNVAGKVHIAAQFYIYGIGVLATETANLVIAKNGTIVSYTYLQVPFSAANNQTIAIDDQFSCNGTTDYFELQLINGAATDTYTIQSGSSFGHACFEMSGP